MDFNSQIFLDTRTFFHGFSDKGSILPAASLCVSAAAKPRTTGPLTAPPRTGSRRPTPRPFSLGSARALVTLHGIHLQVLENVDFATFGLRPVPTLWPPEAQGVFSRWAARTSHPAFATTHWTALQKTSCSC